MSKNEREGSQADESITISCSDGSLSADLTFSYRFKIEDVPKVQRQYREEDGVMFENVSLAETRVSKEVQEAIEKRQ